MRLLQSPLLAAAGFTHGFPERGLDDAALSAALGVGAIVQARQVHGSRVVEATEAAGAEADAVVARPPPDAGAPPMAAGVRVADCVPILVADEATGAVAAIHAGWRGVVAGVVAAAAGRLASPGSRLVAAIGPCIGPCCFEVGADVADAIASASAGGSSAAEPRIVVRREGAKAYVDLRAAVRAQLASLGIPGERVEDVAGCTKHEPDRFHSFRRDGASSGRMLAAIASRRYG